MKWSRRQVLRWGGAGAAAALLGPLRRLRAAPADPGDGRFLVVVNLLGGNDGVNTVVPRDLAPYYERRPVLALKDTLDLGNGSGFHPALEGLHALWGRAEVHVVHGVGYPDANLSHFLSQDIYSLGVRQPGNADGRGWLGRFADAHCVDPLGVVALGTGKRADFLAQRQGTLVLRDVEGFRIQHDQDSIPDHLRRVEHARRILQREAPPPAGPAATAFAAARDAHDLVERVQAETAAWTDPGLYPATGLGRSFRAMSRLLSGDFGTRIYYTALGGFDTHANQAVRHGALLAELDGALAAFAADLRAKGRWRDCAVVCISEFGRRNAENGSGGTDHGHGNTFLVLGGAVEGGATGALTEADLLGDQPPMRIDFRDLYTHLIGRHLDLDPAPVFPEPFARTGALALL